MSESDVEKIVERAVRPLVARITALEGGPQPQPDPTPEPEPTPNV